MLILLAWEIWVPSLPKDIKSLCNKWVLNSRNSLKEKQIMLRELSFIQMPPPEQNSFHVAINIKNKNYFQIDLELDFHCEKWVLIQMLGPVLNSNNASRFDIQRETIDFPTYPYIVQLYCLSFFFFSILSYNYIHVNWMSNLVVLFEFKTDLIIWINTHFSQCKLSSKSIWK